MASYGVPISLRSQLRGSDGIAPPSRTPDDLKDTFGPVLRSMRPRSNVRRACFISLVSLDVTGPMLFSGWTLWKSGLFGRQSWPTPLYGLSNSDANRSQHSQMDPTNPSMGRRLLLLALLDVVCFGHRTDAHTLSRTGTRRASRAYEETRWDCFFYFDLRNGAIVESYGPAERWDRWLYNGLHSLDFPLLYRTRPIWDVLVIAFMLGGIALSATACGLALRRLKKRLVKPIVRWRAKRFSSEL